MTDISNLTVISPPAPEVSPGETELEISQRDIDIDFLERILHSMDQTILVEMAIRLLQELK